MTEIWQLIAGAGPLGVAAVLFVAAWLERTRANDERIRNADLVDRTFKGLSDAADGVRQVNESLRAVDANVRETRELLVRSFEAGRK